MHKLIWGSTYGGPRAVDHSPGSGHSGCGRRRFQGRARAEALHGLVRPSINPAQSQAPRLPTPAYGYSGALTARRLEYRRRPHRRASATFAPPQGRLGRRSAMATSLTRPSKRSPAPLSGRWLPRARWTVPTGPSAVPVPVSFAPSRPIQLGSSDDPSRRWRPLRRSLNRVPRLGKRAGPTPPAISPARGG